MHMYTYVHVHLLYVYACMYAQALMYMYVYSMCIQYIKHIYMHIQHMYRTLHVRDFLSNHRR